MTNPKKQTSEAAVREIRRRTRRKFSPEEKIRIVLEGFRGEESVSDLCRREGIASNLYYRWSKDFLEAGKKQLAGDTVREATSDEVKDLRSENRELKEVVAEITLKNRVLKKSLTGHGEEDRDRRTICSGQEEDARRAQVYLRTRPTDHQRLDGTVTRQGTALPAFSCSK
ncbi:MAG: transposase [Proteobacteria bacterium]|nr:transposase [Pseudomonadota bacterium]